MNSDLTVSNVVFSAVRCVLQSHQAHCSVNGDLTVSHVVFSVVRCVLQSHQANASVNGHQTLNENIADYGGLTAAFLALDHLLQVSVVRTVGALQCLPVCAAESR